MFSGHPYAIKEGTEAEVLASNKGIVDMNFINVGTAWVRVMPDGTINDHNYTLTYNEIGGIGRRRSQLPPGTYFLNGIIGNSMTSGYYIRSLIMENFGWDAENKQARCFSFTIKAGEVLTIPDIEVNYNPLLANNKTICPILTFVDDTPTSTSFAIGPDSK